MRKKNIGFGWPQTENACGPVELRVRTQKPVYLYGNYVPKMKSLDTKGKWMRVLCMNGKNFDNERRFFIKELHEPMAYQVSQGNFEIRFNPKTFFVLTRAGKRNSSAFWTHAVVGKPSDLVLFGEMISRSEWPLELKNWAREQLQKLANTQ